MNTLFVVLVCDQYKDRKTAVQETWAKGAKVFLLEDSLVTDRGHFSCVPKYKKFFQAIVPALASVVDKLVLVDDDTLVDVPGMEALVVERTSALTKTFGSKQLGGRPIDMGGKLVMQGGAGIIVPMADALRVSAYLEAVPDPPYAWCSDTTLSMWMHDAGIPFDTVTCLRNGSLEEEIAAFLSGASLTLHRVAPPTMRELHDRKSRTRV